MKSVVLDAFWRCVSVERILSVVVIGMPPRPRQLGWHSCRGLSGDVTRRDWSEPVDQVGNIVLRLAPVEHRRCGNLRSRDVHVAVRTCRYSIGPDHLRIGQVGTVLAIGTDDTDRLTLDGGQIEVAG